MRGYALSGRIVAALIVTAGIAAPAAAQDQPGPANVTGKTVPQTAKPAGAASSSYARCVPGAPAAGHHGEAAPPHACPAPAAEATDHRTYTGGRRTGDADAVAAATPGRLSMTPSTARQGDPAAAQSCPAPAGGAQGRLIDIGTNTLAAAPACAPAAVAGPGPAQPGKSISEKGVSGTRSR